LSVFLISISIYGFSQKYKPVDNIVKQYPSYSDLNTLSIRINNDFNSDEKKARALFTWLAYNIDYYTDKSIKSNFQLIFSEYDRLRIKKNKNKEIIKQAITNKRTNCNGFALMFNEVCNLLNIESQIIEGYAKANINDIGENKSLKNHAWNAVKINNKWQLLDVTWASGYEDRIKKQIVKKFNDYYFFTPPKRLINSHFPAGFKWQLLSKIITKKDFFSSPIFYPEYFNSNSKISNNKGVITTSKKNNHILIYFDTINHDNDYSYGYTNDKYAKRFQFIKQKNDSYQAKLKYSKKENSNLTLYYKSQPLASFKVKVE